MQCKICGSNLVRGFTFCLECGTPVPAELLEESGLPDRNIDRGPQEIEPPATSRSAADTQTDEQVGELQPKLIGEDMDVGEALKPQLIGGDTYEQGKALKPKLMGVGEDEAGEALKPQLIGGEEQTGSGKKVKATFQNSSSDVSDGSAEKLMFCPNCGMHMQHDPVKCEICGMLLGNPPNNVPTTSSGIPLFNTGSDPFSGSGGFGGGPNGLSGFSGLSDEDVSRIDNFTKGNTDPMFNSGSSAFNVQTTPDDLARLTEQLSSFSSAAIPNIGVTENTRIRQIAAPKGKDVQLSDFSMTDDLQSESIPITDSNVPVVGDYSMEENPDEYINLDPFAFVGMSMDEDPQPSVQNDAVAEPPIAEPVPHTPEPKPISEPAPKPISEPKPAPKPVVENIDPEPIKPPSLFGRTHEEDEFEETAPFIAEETPVIGETELPEPISAKAPNAEPASAAPKRPVTDQTAAPAARREETPVQTPERDRSEDRNTQPDQPVQKSADKMKKCFACGKSMPAKDKFCPNCGRSMYGIPNPNLAPPPPPPPAPKKKPIVFVIVAVILIVIVVVIIFATKGSAAEIDLGELSRVVSDAEQTFTETVSEYFILS